MSLVYVVCNTYSLLVFNNYNVKQNTKYSFEALRLQPKSKATPDQTTYRHVAHNYISVYQWLLRY